MESETQNLGMDTTSSDNIAATSSSDGVAGTGGAKKKAKKKDSGSDLAFFASFPCIVIAIAAVAITVVGFVPMGFIGYMCASVRAQLIIVLLICAVPPLFSPPLRLPMLITCVVFAAVNAAFVVPCMIPKPEPTGDVKSLQVLSTRVMQLSIDDEATPIEPIVEQITALHPEIVCLTGSPMQPLLKLSEQMPPNYMHRETFPRDDGYAMVIYSQVPLKGTRLKKVGPAKLPLVSTTIHFDYGWNRLIMLKVPDPTDDKSLEKRNQQLAACAKAIKEMSGRKIVVGNFNTTPYAVAFGSFLKDANLEDTRIGVQPNWNLGPIDLFVTHVPADHILATSNVSFKSRYVCAPMGLKHRPLLGDFYPNTKENEPYTEEAAEPAAETAAPASEPAAESKPQAAEEKPKKRRRRAK
jgi:endonuclease/exonuclease/phosphatase (EEP) superfamily protein YafD